MKMKNSVAAVAGIALLAAGYVGGAYFGWPGQDDELLGGNIGKANLFNSQEPDPEILAYQEALQTDSALQQKAVVSAILLSSRVDQLDSLADASIAATEGIAELADANAELKALKRKTTNAKKSYDALMQQTEVVLKGGKSETYEQASNNALLAFTILDNEILECRTMVDKMAEFIEENENENISNALGGWITYCAEDAALNANAVARGAQRSRPEQCLAGGRTCLCRAEQPGARTSPQPHAGHGGARQPCRSEPLKAGAAELCRRLVHAGDTHNDDWRRPAEPCDVVSTLTHAGCRHAKPQPHQRRRGSDAQQRGERCRCRTAQPCEAADCCSAVEGFSYAACSSLCAAILAVRH